MNPGLRDSRRLASTAYPGVSVTRCARPSAGSGMRSRQAGAFRPATARLTVDISVWTRSASAEIRGIAGGLNSGR